MKVLYEVIAKTDDGRGGISVHTEVLDFDNIDVFKNFKENIEAYESVNGLQVWRTVTIIN
ncbi:hypothetical protein [Klebsiella phage Kpn6N]|nr:hypothetical protein [Klebsiella phage Kpn6N]